MFDALERFSVLAFASFLGALSALFAVGFRL